MLDNDRLKKIVIYQAELLEDYYNSVLYRR